jgi:periplasmic copper chaperone A
MNLMILYFYLINLFAPQVTIENAWMRNANAGMNTALYFDIKNSTRNDCELTEVTSDIAKVVQIHETYKAGENMGMRKVGSIIIKAGTTFRLAPGGFHVMVIRLKESLKAGDKKQFILYFKNQRKIKITAVVKDV